MGTSYYFELHIIFTIRKRLCFLFFFHNYLKMEKSFLGRQPFKGSEQAGSGPRAALDQPPPSPFSQTRQRSQTSGPPIGPGRVGGAWGASRQHGSGRKSPDWSAPFGIRPIRSGRRSRFAPPRASVCVTLGVRHAPLRVRDSLPGTGTA